MKRVSEPKVLRVRDEGRTDASRVSTAERVRVVRVSGQPGRGVRWHVSRPSPKS
jgi:hypothetical protein